MTLVERARSQAESWRGDDALQAREPQEEDRLIDELADEIERQAAALTMLIVGLKQLGREPALARATVLETEHQSRLAA